MNINSPKVGLIPFYIALYDEVLPELRKAFRETIEKVIAGLSGENLEVIELPICCRKAEFDHAVSEAETAGVELLVSLHLAYSPSLESLPALSRSKLPLLMLDTTLDEDFGLDTDPQRILYNHGIHGVMDLASVLRRNKRPFAIVAGGIGDKELYRRAAGYARGAQAARRFRGMRCLRLGDEFRGMGDFKVDPEVLRSVFEIEVVPESVGALEPFAKEISSHEIEKERLLDLDRYDVDSELTVDSHRRTLRVSLALRKYLEQNEFGAFSVNFLSFDSPEEPVNTVPFLECSKAMARGLGYAGEGDVLTAPLVGALGASFGDVTFTEAFCPDWNGGSIFLSHMGEINPDIAAFRPLLYERDFPFTPAKNPVVVSCAPRPGDATLVNLAPGPDNTFRLIAAPMTVLGDGTHPDMAKVIRGWIRPKLDLPTFLEEYSRIGGTHHKALMLGNHCEALKFFAELTGMEFVQIG